MKKIRVVWKDSIAPMINKDIVYRKHTISWNGTGWIITIPGDDNIYRNTYSALNAIDEALGGYGQQGEAKRKGDGIQVIGKK